jgi:ABC-type multidrug transport system ATPase subunit
VQIVCSHQPAFSFPLCLLGKSTTISVLIGRLRATLGEQYIAGENVINGLSKVHRFIGVCPQFDVVWTDLTVAEHLSFQARQRGIPPNLVSGHTLHPFKVAILFD